MEHYIGMDAHSKTCVFVVVDAKGKELDSCRINTSENNIVKYVKSFKGKTHLTFEESQLSRWLHVVLKDQVDHLVVCNPCFIAKRSGAKNDFADALHLAQQLRGDFLTPVFHNDSALSDLRKIVGGYEDLVRDVIKAKNRYKALFVSRAIDVAGREVYKNEEFIDKLDTASQFVARQLFRQIQEIENAKLNYRKEFEKNCKSQREIAALASIPGISAVRANVIAAAVCDPNRFENKNKFWSYCMLVKHDQQSDGKSYGKVSVFGKASLKAAFIGAALTNIQSENKLRQYYDEDRKSGLDYKAARKNLARHIAAISLALMKSGKLYEERIKEIKTITKV